MVRHGTLAAIRDALTKEPEGFHVLHLSCHAQPGRLLLETDDGGEDLIDAQRFWEEAVPAGAGLPLVVLSGCSTGLSLRQARRGGDGASAASGQGEQALASFARQLADRGAAQVLAMQAPAATKPGSLSGSATKPARPSPTRTSDSSPTSGRLRDRRDPLPPRTGDL